MAVHQQYDADWVLKLDDDVYITPNRLSLAMDQWDAMHVDYVGCMKHGDVRKEVEHRYRPIQLPMPFSCSTARYTESC